jgi:hypothetical protein
MRSLMFGFGIAQVPVFSLLKMRMNGYYNLFLLIIMKIGSGFGKLNSQPTFSSLLGNCYMVPFLHEEFFNIAGYVI